MEEAKDGFTLALNYLGSDLFKRVLEASDLKLVHGLLRLYGKELNRAIPDVEKMLLDLTQGVAIFGYLESKYAAQAERLDQDLTTMRAQLDSKVRDDLMNAKIRLTEAMVTAHIEQDPTYVALTGQTNVLRHLCKLFTEFKYGLIRMHESYLEVSRNERTLLRKED